jgi:hypothetical protein
MKESEKYWAELLGKFLAALAWICIYALLIMLVWSWSSSFMALPKMGFWVALAIYVLASKLTRRN